MATTLFPSSNEGLMGLVEKHPIYSELFILFFNEGSLDNFKVSDLRKYINGGGSLHRLTAHQMRDVIPNRWWER
jgi:hypothetical protein